MSHEGIPPEGTERAGDAPGAGPPPDPLVRSPQGQWFILHVRPRHEKALADDLAGMRVAYFLPLITLDRLYGARKARISVLLFPGYLFLHGTIEQAYSADRTGHVARVLRVADQAQLDWELRNIAIVLAAGAPLDPYPFLEDGRRVEVRSGPFRGLQGRIDTRNRNRFVLEVEMVGQACTLELDGALLEPIDE